MHDQHEEQLANLQRAYGRRGRTGKLIDDGFVLQRCNESIKFLGSVAVVDVHAEW